jgi:dolichol-phosphate mannosyltransferase
MLSSMDSARALPVSSETNRARLRKLGVEFTHGDIRSTSDFEILPKVDWVIDAAANPSVLAGVGTGGTSRQLLEHNLASLINVLEYCKRHSAGLTLLSSSRVYSISALVALPLRDTEKAFELDDSDALPGGVSSKGVGPEFSTQAPISLYGSTKLACEVLALEYGEAFGFPVWVNRCGVLAGAGQFGTPDQGIFAFWVNARLRQHPLKCLGFDGRGKQVRDALNPRDLGGLIREQMRTVRNEGRRIYTAGGGPANAMSLRQLNDWCDGRSELGSPPVNSYHGPTTFPGSQLRRQPGFRLEPRRYAGPNLERDRRAWRTVSGLPGAEWAMKSLERQDGRPPLRLLSVVIPACNEEGCIAATVEHLDLELRLKGIDHEIVVVNDGSTDATWSILCEVKNRVHALVPVLNDGRPGFGRAVVFGFDHVRGDAVVVMMADEADDCRDVVRYWNILNEGWDAVFGSRFIKGGGIIDYPVLKLWINRLANLFLRLLFNVPLNDFTNAFKGYRRTVIEGCRPFLSPHFNMTVELPLKAIVRGYSWTVVPITWRNRRVGESKLKLKEMGSRYLFIALYCWLEKYFSRGDFNKQ